MSDMLEKKRLDCRNCVDKPLVAHKVDLANERQLLTNERQILTNERQLLTNERPAFSLLTNNEPGSKSENSKLKFRHPRTRTELASYYLHFMGPKPFYKTYSYV